jgi:malate synthase
MASAAQVEGVEIGGPVEGRHAEVLSAEALGFVAGLHRRFEPTRHELLRRRAERQAALDHGGTLDFLEDTREVREGDWEVAPAPPALRKRWVEITGPTDLKLTIGALNSGADGWMADFEDSLSPTWANVVGGQLNLLDAVSRTIEFDAGDGDVRRLNEDIATMLIRPRGWHLTEKHVLVDGTPIAGGLFDFGLFLFHNARALLDQGSGPFFYLPKMESHLEARLWNDVFVHAQEALGLDRGTIRATVLIETFPAAFEMDEILYELREHSAGLNAGRWDYIFSAIKSFRHSPQFVQPDRSKVTMTVPFMRAYSELLVRTCHRRGAHAMGGMAAFIPSRRKPEINEGALSKVAEDKEREAGDGFDGTWVAHPDTVATARAEFEKVIGDGEHQLERKREDVSVSAADLLDVKATPGEVTEEGLRDNINVGIQYISSWLRGNGAAGIHNMMEDAATAEISRSQVWHWIRHGVTLADGGPLVTEELVRRWEDEELEKIREEVGDEFFAESRAEESKHLFEGVALGTETFVNFLTIPAYDYID